MAEKEGFEPSMRYQRIHEFQSCAINRARRLLHCLNSISETCSFVKSSFLFFAVFPLLFSKTAIDANHLPRDEIRFVRGQKK